MSICSIGAEIALAAVNECSTLYRPFELAGITPMILLALFLILQDLCSKATEWLVLVIHPIETMVSAISGV